MLEPFVQSFFKEGRLGVRLPNGRFMSIGGVTEADAPLIVVVRDNATALSIVRNPTLAVGEAYMDGGLMIERGSLYDLMLLASQNLRHYRPRLGPFSEWRKRGKQKNRRVASRRNVAHHYNISNELFRLFLDADMQYSCAYFRDPGMSLEEAQSAKKRHIAAKLLLEPGHQVLDIGCGWGGLGLELAEQHGVEVTGITLSDEQLAVAQKRSLARGLRDKARFALRDYRDEQTLYDRIVSIGMFEHVGAPNFQTYFDTVARLLKPDGVALIHTIGNSAGVSGTTAWTDKYIFPGGCVPSLSDAVAAAERAGLVITDVEILRLHYAETLRAWRERFMARREEAKAMFDERFCRMWEFYLAGSEASFRSGSYVVFQFQLAKRNDAVPITRDYITDFDRAVAHEGMRIAAE